jgi:hypothetical protein
VREHRNIFSEIFFLQWLWKRTMNFFRDKNYPQIFLARYCPHPKRKQAAMFVPNLDQNKCFPRLPEKRRSAIAPRLSVSLFKIADKSTQYLSILGLIHSCG